MQESACTCERLRSSVEVELHASSAQSPPAECRSVSSTMDRRTERARCRFPSSCDELLSDAVDTTDGGATVEAPGEATQLARSAAAPSGNTTLPTGVLCGVPCSEIEARASLSAVSRGTAGFYVARLPIHGLMYLAQARRSGGEHAPSADALLRCSGWTRDADNTAPWPPARARNRAHLQELQRQMRL